MKHIPRPVLTALLAGWVVAVSVSALSGCAAVKTMDLNMGPRVSKRHIAKVRTRARQRYDASILKSLPGDAKRNHGVLAQQAYLLKQGLYLDRAGQVKSLTPHQEKHVNLAPPPAKVVARAKRHKTRPVVLSVPSNQ